MDTVVKLNGPAAPLSLDPFWIDASVEFELNDGLAGLRRLGSVEPRGLRGGNVSTDKELRLFCEGRSGEGGWSDGGLGERGGRGMGRLEAMVIAASEAAGPPSLTTEEYGVEEQQRDRR